MQLRIAVRYGKKRYEARVGVEWTSSSTVRPFSAVPCAIRLDGTGSTLRVELSAEEGLELEAVALETERRLRRGETVFMNGYQSWTDSRELAGDDRMDGLGALARLLDGKYRFSAYGDYRFVKGRSRRGAFHGFSYCYFRDGPEFELFGSLDEDSAFTVFTYDRASSSFGVRRDCRGRLLAGGESFRALAVGRYCGGDRESFDGWFSDLRMDAPKAAPLAGWTSWYDHYDRIDEGIIRANLEALRKAAPGRRAFQIDDGWQTAVGDWLSIDHGKFPRALAPLVTDIHGAGFIAGLWLAPFAAAKDSALAREHPEWLLRDRKGRPLEGGSNWGGFYGLDIRRPDFRAYLEKVFRTVLDDWGFDLVKLDFLYAACLRSFPLSTRGELMASAMRFLREVVGDKLILACGVPLASAFGRSDYCRIGCDVAPDWKGPRYMEALHRERVSTPRAIRNAVGRRHLDGRAFRSDPDVFILRSERNTLSEKQRELLYFINTLFGSLVFTSDKVDEYGMREAELFRGIDAAMGRTCLDLREHGGGAIELRYRENGSLWTALANLTDRRLELTTSLGNARQRRSLEAFELITTLENA